MTEGEGAGRRADILLSLVVPVYNERETLPELFRRIAAVLGEIAEPAEVIFVDDGSSDGTPEYCRNRAAEDSRTKLVRLSRNFGHQAAISAGLDYSRGAAVVIMDGDLQDPPELIPEFLRLWRQGYDVVYAIRRTRAEGWPKRTAYSAFYRLLARVSSVEIPRDSGDFGLMDRRVVDLLLRMPERNRFLRGLRSWVGLRQIGVEVDRMPRAAGAPKYTLSKLRGLAMDGLISFSYLPLRLATRFGFLISGAAFLYALWVVVRRLVWGTVVQGFAALIVAIALLGGIQLITIGIMGEYIGRIYDEVKRRPLYLVAETVNLAHDSDRSLTPREASPATIERRL